MVGLQRERYYNRLLLIATIVILTVVIGLVGWGALYNSVILPRRVVAVVEGEEIRGSEFKTRVQVNRQNMVDTYMQYAQNYQLFGQNDVYGQQLLEQMYQIQNQLDPLNVGAQTITQMIDDRLLNLEAEELGIVVTEAEIDQRLEELFGYYPDGRPTATTAPTLIPTSTLSEQQYALVSATPTATTTSTPTATATPNADEEDAPTPTVTHTPNFGVSATPLPSATPISFDSYQTQYNEYLSLQEQELGLDEQDLRELVRVAILREKFFELANEAVSQMQTQVWARHILVADVATANEVLDRLDAGEDWNDLALEYSLDTSNAATGGDLGWFNFETMVEEFAIAAFGMDVGQTSGPVASSFGLHIIQVLGNEERQLTPSQYDQLRQIHYQAEINQLRAKYDYEVYDVWQQITPDEPNIPLDYRLTTN